MCSIFNQNGRKVVRWKIWDAMKSVTNRRGKLRITKNNRVSKKRK